ncbi:lateral signaling target protein 2 homolog [Anthonomus grandis grandis]|uniref:lateral signaling target protein 2 homolog n=1 Tax=Anthonomus grandis grandis TaxID=2921223 RepID=UPI002165A991|nr:lateral signaling target protein 2 homolog [Anthonomus grandis grandis]
MESIRKWLYKPKKDDKSLLAQFFYADEELNKVANELDSFDGRKDPERCTTLVNQLRQAQDYVLIIINAIMDAVIGDERANRGFRVKFPEDVLQDNLAGQLWFGAECLAAGSSIMNREFESTSMRPIAKAVTKSLENVRNLLREASLNNNTPNGPIKLDDNDWFTEMLLESLKIFDRLFAEFELAYVSAMVPVKSTQEYELQELIGVLFSETLQRALKMNLLTQEMVDDCDPALMFTIPRLAIVSGLLIYPNGPLCIDRPMDKMSEMFRPFRTLLHKIRELLWILNKRELFMLEKLLCDNEQLDGVRSVNVQINDEDFEQFYNDFPVYQDLMFNSFEESVTPTEETPQKKIVTESDLVLDGPSTSGYLIPKNVVRNTIIASSASPNPRGQASSVESPPDHDSLEVISAAAATLSSILTINESASPKKTLNDPESPDDSGICTETTSLDRSPSLEISEHKDCQRNSPCKKSALRHRKTQSCLKKSPCGRQRSPVNDITNSGSSSSSETSSFNSNSADDEEIAYAIKAVEMANREELRAKYRSSEDLIHRLFVCIAGVADQLQTNFACDLRNILKSVFLINASDSNEQPPPLVKTPDTHSLDTSIEYHPSEDEVIENNEFSVDPNILAQEALFDTNVYFHLDSENCPGSDAYTNHPRQYHDIDESLSADLTRFASIQENDRSRQERDAEEPPPSDEVNERLQAPPVWIPDVQAPKCMSCGLNFTVMKRRHHCRNCGKVFCARCSSNSVPLPKFGLVKPVRVCNKCFMFNLTPFTIH